MGLTKAWGKLVKASRVPANINPKTGKPHTHDKANARRVKQAKPS